MSFCALQSHREEILNSGWKGCQAEAHPEGEAKGKRSISFLGGQEGGDFQEKAEHIEQSEARMGWILGVTMELQRVSTGEMKGGRPENEWESDLEGMCMSYLGWISFLRKLRAPQQDIVKRRNCRERWLREGGVESILFSLRNVSITEDHEHRECRSRLVIQRRVCTQVNQKGSELGADVGKYEARGG